MTVYQETHKKIDQFPEETVHLFIQLMDRMIKDPEVEVSNAGKKSKFLKTAGTIDVDENAVLHLREVSVI